MLGTTNSNSITDLKVEQLADSATSTGLPVLLSTVSTSGDSGITKYVSGVTITPSTSTITATTFSGALNGNSSTATTLAVQSTDTAPSTNAGVQFFTGTILSQSGVWCIETYTDGTNIIQRATNIADPSNVCVRTSTDAGTNWTGWIYSYAVWKV